MTLFIGSLIDEGVLDIPETPYLLVIPFPYVVKNIGGYRGYV
jgi:hypothetical protein